MSSRNNYVSPMEEDLAENEQNIAQKKQAVDGWVASGNYPSNVKVTYEQSLELEKVYKELVERLAKEPNFKQELARVQAIRIENLRHITILAPVCGQKPPAATAQVMNQGPKQRGESKDSGCCAIS